MLRTALAASLALALGSALAAPSLAQQAQPAAPVRPAPVKDAAAAPAGVYNLDLNHSSVIARVGHGGGVSLSTLRFAATRGVLTWDPANPAGIKVEATVNTKPHYAPITYNVTPEGAQFLNAERFPEATFVSTSVTRTSPTSATVNGNLTLMGQTRPVTMRMDLVGVGQTLRGQTAVGFSGTMELKRSDFGMSNNLPAVGDNITLLIDGEFVKS